MVIEVNRNQSTTPPCRGEGSRKMRSSRLPIAPPSSSPIATAVSFAWTRKATTTRTTTAAAANSEIATVWPWKRLFGPAKLR